MPGRDPGVAQAERATADRAAAAVRMNWAQRLKRVFAIDVQKCAQCGGRVRIIAAIEDPEDPEVTEKILRHLGLEEGERPAGEALPRGRRRVWACSSKTRRRRGGRLAPVRRPAPPWAIQ